MTANTPAEVLRQAREALKPCPFCGLSHPLKLTTAQELAEEGEDDPEPWMHSDSWTVLCDASRPNGPGGCGASGGFFPSEAEAVANWNRRAAIDALPSAPAWPCHCDERGIGKPGVTCGDCPRDYGHAVSSAPSGEPAAEAAPNDMRVHGPFHVSYRATTAPAPLPADTLCQRLQQQCTDWGVYWRASDAHGVDLSHEQALELLRDALGVEVAIAAPLLSNGPETGATASVAGLADHAPAGPEAEAATDAALGMVLLPPIRVSANTYAALKRIAEARGMVLQAVVREALEPGETMGAAPQAAPVPAPSELEAARWEGIQSVQAQTAVIVRAALELLDAAGDNFPPETLTAFRRVFGGASSTAAAAPEPVAAKYLFIQMDDDNRAWHRWCADAAEVREAVKAAMFILPAGEELSAEHADQLDASVEVLIDDGCLTFEGDPPLYLYRMALSAWTKAPATHPAPAVAATVRGLTDAQFRAIYAEAHDLGPDPYVSQEDMAFGRGIEAAHGIATPAAPKGQQ